jgi:ribonuclease J
VPARSGDQRLIAAFRSSLKDFVDVGVYFSIGIAITAKGDVAGDPDVVLAGLPARTKDGKAMDQIVDEVVFSVLDSLPRNVRRNADATATAVERGVRNTVRNHWGKRPTVHVLVMEV